MLLKVHCSFINTQVPSSEVIPPSQKSRYLGTCVFNGLWRKLSLEGQYKVKRMLEVLDL